MIANLMVFSALLYAANSQFSSTIISKIVDENACNLAAERGMCKGFFKRFHYDSALNGCAEFVFGGCGGNLNNFVTKEECESKCVVVVEKPIISTEPKNKFCELPKAIGICKAMIQRYYFDTTTNDCVKFHYTGCHGNGNNFATYDECAKMCMTK